MKSYIDSSSNSLVQDLIRVTMYLHPVVYEDSEVVLGSAHFDAKQHEYHTDVNPSRTINGPLSEYREELEGDIKAEFDLFKNDCVWLVKELGFTIIKQETSRDSTKSEYLVVFGMNDDPCGTLVFDIRISDHPFDATFPEEYKDEVLKYLQMDRILDGSATKANIDFTVEQVIVGGVSNDTWERAFKRLYSTLKHMRNRVSIRLKERRNSSADEGN